MTLTDIAAIEEALAIRLPDFYQKILLNYPPALHAADREEYLWSEAKDIIEMNQMMQTIEHAMLIGDDGCGNYYFINTDNRDEAVLFIDHEASEEEEPSDYRPLLTKQADTIEAYIEFVLSLG